jgi:hypothetical protein
VSILGCDDSVSPCHDCSWTDSGERVSEIIARSFVVDDGATIEVDNFAGRVSYRTGPGDTVRVRAIKRTVHRAELDRIDVEMSTVQGGLRIRTENLDDLKNVSVDLEVTAPESAQPRLITGVGAIDYQGRPDGNCVFTAGVGSITLRLSPDVSIVVDLSVGVGSIVVHFNVEGSVRVGCVNGRIGGGYDGAVHATTGVGHIRLIQQ